MSARFLIEDLLTKSSLPENYLKEEKKQVLECFNPSLLNQHIPNNKIIEKITKEEKVLKGGQSEEEFTNIKIKNEKPTNDCNFGNLKSVQHYQNIEEIKQQENGFSISPTWFLPQLHHSQQHKNNLNIKLLSQLPQQFQINSNKFNSSNFFPFFGNFINNIYSKNQQQQQINNNLINHNNQQQQHKRKGGQIRFSNEQTDILEKTFDAKKYLSTIERKRIAKMLKLSERQVKTWFQNRRAKHRRQAPAEDSTENEILFNQQQQQQKYNNQNNDLFNSSHYHYEIK